MVNKVNIFLKLLFTFLIFSSAAYASNANTCSFTLNGEAIDPYMTPLTELGIDDPRFLVTIDRLTLLLEPKDSYDFTSYLQTHKTTLILNENGQKKLVGLIVNKKTKNYIIEDYTSIRGISIECKMDDKVNKILSSLDYDNSFVSLDGAELVTVDYDQMFADSESDYTSDDALPELPSGIKYFQYQESHSPAISDFTSLKTLNSLVFFDIETWTEMVFDAGLLKNNKNLTFLNIDSYSLKVKNLNKLENLRFLNLKYNKEIKNIKFVKSMSKLERLLIPGTTVKDLSPISSLENLKYVNANMAPVKKLPNNTIANLEELYIMGSDVENDKIDQFEVKNPNCKVYYDWTETLHRALEDVDRIRVRSGGTCHRRIEEEQTLFEIVSDDEIQKTISNIQIAPEGSGFHCMCCGNPTFEFYKNDELIETVGFHHGQSLRWDMGQWPGDGELTNDSAEYLCILLDKHGINEPLAQKKYTQQQEIALQAEKELMAVILPQNISQLLGKAESGKDQVNAFISGEKDKDKRIKVVLELLGCTFGSWNTINTYNSVLLAVLGNEMVCSEMMGMFDTEPNSELDPKDQITVKDIIRVLLANKENERVVRGAARWFFSENKYFKLPADDKKEYFHLIAVAGLTHPRETNRVKTFKALKALGSQNSIEILRNALAGKYKVLSLPEELFIEPAGMVSYGPGDSDYPDGYSIQVYAAITLAQLGDQESLEDIRKLYDSEDGIEVKAKLKEAISILEKKSE